MDDDSPAKLPAAEQAKPNKGDTRRVVGWR
jgi:hypothetical protein